MEFVVVMDNVASVTATVWEIELLMKIRRLSPDHQVSLRSYIDNLLKLTNDDSKDVSLISAAE